MGNVESRSGFSDRRIGQIKWQAGKPLTDCSNIAERALRRAVQPDRPALHPIEKIECRKIVNAPGKQRRV